jgi:hypothetical protein
MPLPPLRFGRQERTKFGAGGEEPYPPPTDPARSASRVQLLQACCMNLIYGSAAELERWRRQDTATFRFPLLLGFSSGPQPSTVTRPIPVQ